MSFFREQSESKYDDSDFYNQDEFDKKNRPNFFENLKFWIKGHTFLSLVIVSIFIIAVIVISIILVANNNNPINGFVKGSSKLIDRGGFNFTLSASKNGNQQLNYEGAIKFDESKIAVEAYYDAIYPEYTFSSATFTNKKDRKTYLGNFYDGRWIVVEDEHRVSDFFDFYKDFKYGRFDANAYVSFFEKNGELVPTEMNKTVNNILNELKSGTTSILHCIKTKDGGNTIYTFTPELDKVFEIIKKNNGPAFMSADEYQQYVKRIEVNMDNLKKANLVIKYVLDDTGTLSEIDFDLANKDNTYSLKANFSEAGNPNVNIPKSFFTACNIDIESETTK